MRMPGLFDPFIHLPKDYIPKFPEQCVRCGLANPSHGVTLWTPSSNPMSYVPVIGILATGTARVTFPACRKCAWMIRVRRLTSFGLLGLSIVGTAYAAKRLTAGWPRTYHHLTVMAAILAGVLPWACLEATFRQPVMISLKGDKIEYYFRSNEFSYAFKLKNLEAMRGKQAE